MASDKTEQKTVTYPRLVATPDGGHTCEIEEGIFICWHVCDGVYRLRIETDPGLGGIECVSVAQVIKPAVH
jgi:hypothetical protein